MHIRYFLVHHLLSFSIRAVIKMGLGAEEEGGETTIKYLTLYVSVFLFRVGYKFKSMNRCGTQRSIKHNP